MKYLSKIIFILILSATVFPSLKAESIKEEVKAFRKAAERGNTDAQYRLGLYYLTVTGEDKNQEEGIKWVKRSAEAGDSTGQALLGSCYSAGDGVEKDFEEAFKWYKKSAEQNNPVGEHRLGLCYFNGEGIKKDSTEALKLFSKAAEKGYKEAQYTLGYCYYSGNCVKQNFEKSIKWLTEAAEKNFVQAQVLLGFLYEEGIKKNYQEAVKWYSKAAEQGDEDSICRLGRCYAIGLGIEKNKEKAIKLFKQASENGNEQARLNLWLYQDPKLHQAGELHRTLSVSGKANQMNIECDQDAVYFIRNFTNMPIEFCRSLGYCGLKNLSADGLQALIKEQNYIELIKHIRTETDLKYIQEILEPLANEGHTLMMFELCRAKCLSFNSQVYSQDEFNKIYEFWYKGCALLEMDIACSQDSSLKNAVAVLSNCYRPEGFITHKEKNVICTLTPKEISESLKKINFACSPSPQWVLYHGMDAIEGKVSLTSYQRWPLIRKQKLNEIINFFNKS